MKSSVRNRLFLQMAFIVILFAACIIFINRYYLERFYISQEKTMLHRQAQAIDDLATTNYSAIALKLEEIEKTHNVVIAIADTSGRPIYSTNPFPPLERPSGIPLPPREPTGFQPSGQFHLLHSESLGPGRFEILQDHRMNIRYLVYRQTLSNGHLIDIRVIQNVIERNVAIANTFMVTFGVFVLAASLAWAFFFSQRFTEPLIQMRDVTSSMAKLDFSRKCEPYTNDEIGELGFSINNLSERLHSALNELSEKNAVLQQDIERERQLERMRREFVSNASHELKTPIAIIQGYAEGLRTNVADSIESKHYYCSVIIDEATKMNKLVRDLLELSLLESGQFSLTKTSFDLASLIQQVLAKYHTLFEDYQVTIETNTPDQALVFADIIRVEQVITNYLNNALVHTDGQRVIKVRCDEQQGRYRVSVYNSGPNIEEYNIDDIWVSFYKADKARSREEGRYGLGLSIVRAIQELHGSAYGVRNVEDGVVFWFEVEKGSS